jgi:hypothetical protein
MHLVFLDAFTHYTLKEPMYEPPELLRKSIDEMEKDDVAHGRIQFEVLGHGETTIVEKDEAVAHAGSDLSLFSPNTTLPLEIVDNKSDDESATLLIVAS